MMINITLICAAGMSTSMLMNKMKGAAEKNNIEIEVKAMPESKFHKYSGKTDVLLLGPQVGYLFDKYKSEFEPKGVKVTVIDMMDYGMMNGEKVLDDALKLVNN